MIPIAPALALAAALAATEAGAPITSVSVVPAALAADASRYLALRPGRPLDPAEVRRTVELLHATGLYEDVLVESASAPGGIALTVRLVAAPLLAAVEVEGDRVLSEAEVRRASRLRDQEPLWKERLDAAARDVAVAAAREGYLEARVTAAARRGEESAATAVFTITSGPRVRVAAATVATGEAALDTLLTPYVEPDPGEPFDRERARRAADRMRAILSERGRWRATVDPREEYDPAAGTLRLRFQADPGPAVWVRFEGASVPEPVAARVREAVRAGAAVTDAVEEGRDLLETAFHAEGLRRVAVTPSVESGPGRAEVVYAIAPGPRSTVASVRVSVDPGLDLSRVPLRTKAAHALRDADLAEDERALARAA